MTHEWSFKFVSDGFNNSKL